MPFEKIDGKDYWKVWCMDPEHLPPTHTHLEPGTYKYTCPKCGLVTMVYIPEVTCKVYDYKGPPAKVEW